jgi:hypothetical protein
MNACELNPNSTCSDFSKLKSVIIHCNPLQGQNRVFPVQYFHTGKKPVFIAGFPVDENRFFPVGNTAQGKPCFYYKKLF